MIRNLCFTRRVRRVVAPVLMIALVQCSSLGPFEGPDPQGAGDAHTLCYNRASTTPQQLHATAVAACGTGEPHFLEQNLDYSACPLLVPERLSFTCGK